MTEPPLRGYPHACFQELLQISSGGFASGPALAGHLAAFQQFDRNIAEGPDQGPGEQPERLGPQRDVVFALMGEFRRVIGDLPAFGHLGDLARGEGLLPQPLAHFRPCAGPGRDAGLGCGLRFHLLQMRALGLPADQPPVVRGAGIEEVEPGRHDRPGARQPQAGQPDIHSRAQAQDRNGPEVIEGRGPAFEVMPEPRLVPLMDQETSRAGGSELTALPPVGQGMPDRSGRCQPRHTRT
jgi:hypothetical protein